MSSSVADVPGTIVTDASVVLPPASRTLTSALTEPLGVVDATDTRVNDALFMPDPLPVTAVSDSGWPVASR